MAAKDFFEHKLILKTIEDLKNNGIKMEGEFSEDDTDNMDKKIELFELITGSKEDFLFDVLKKDQGDLFKFVFHRANDGSPRPYVMVSSDLVFFTVIKYFPDELEKYLSMFWKTAKKTAKMFTKQYNEALGIVDKK